MRIISTETINKGVSNPSAFIKTCEGRYLKQLKRIVSFLSEQKDEKPIILLSGPSGSGKTTTAFRIKQLLEDKGIKTAALSMDNYFMTAGDPRTVREPDGSIDFESPNRLDTDLLNSHLEKLYRCEQFTLPVFDFENQRTLEGNSFKREEGEMIILEGIHALNPDVTGLVEEQSSGVYVSVRTRIKNSEGDFLDPAKIRLMRRIMRDKLFRGRQPAQTLELFEKVQKGQAKYILPYKCYAEHDVDTFMAYEPAAYKPLLEKELSDLRGTVGFKDYEDMMIALDEINELDKDLSPENSLVREFTGNSIFEY